MMYEELVKQLRYLAKFYSICGNENTQEYKLVVEAADVLEKLSKPQNTVHLCASCQYDYPECPADTNVVFGSGKGNDNICQCADYIAIKRKYE